MPGLLMGLRRRDSKQVTVSHPPYGALHAVVDAHLDALQLQQYQRHGRPHQQSRAVKEKE